MTSYKGDILDLFIQPRKGKPRSAGELNLAEYPNRRIPETLVIEDKRYYFATVDLTDGWIVYSEVNPLAL